MWRTSTRVTTRHSSTQHDPGEHLSEHPESFRRCSDVLYASIHEHGIFPGTGALADTGSGAGEGVTITAHAAPYVSHYWTL